MIPLFILTTVVWGAGLWYVCQCKFVWDIIVVIWRLSIFYCPFHIHLIILFLLLPSNIQGEVKSEEGPEWNILRDDFMMGASMKDWDKESDGEGNIEQGGGLKQEDGSDWMKLKTFWDTLSFFIWIKSQHSVNVQYLEAVSS